jgi:hypothetical protein
MQLKTALGSDVRLSELGHQDKLSGIVAEHALVSFNLASKLVNSARIQYVLWISRFDTEDLGTFVLTISETHPYDLMFCVFQYILI